VVEEFDLMVVFTHLFDKRSSTPVEKEQWFLLFHFVVLSTELDRRLRIEQH